MSDFPAGANKKKIHHNTSFDTMNDERTWYTRTWLKQINLKSEHKSCAHCTTHVHYQFTMRKSLQAVKHRQFCFLFGSPHSMHSSLSLFEGHTHKRNNQLTVFLLTMFIFPSLNLIERPHVRVSLNSFDLLQRLLTTRTSTTIRSTNRKKKDSIFWFSLNQSADVAY